MTQQHRYLPLFAVIASAAIAAVIACGFVVATNAAVPAGAPPAAAGTTTTSTGNPDCPAAAAEFERVKEKMRAAKERVAAARESGDPQRVQRAIAHKREVRQERIAAKSAFREACRARGGSSS